ncbi:MAG: amino acid ABC transporter substrate-binding protein [Usitatibacter sp.]
MLERIVTLVAGMATLLFAHPAHGQYLDGTLLKIKNSGTVALGYRESSPPFSFNAPDGRPAGYSVDLCLMAAGAIQAKLGLPELKVAWVPVTAEDRVQVVVDGKVDLECSTTTASLSRQERVDFSLMTFVDGAGLLTLADRTVRSTAELAGKRLAVIPDTTTERVVAEGLKSQGVTATTVPVKDHAQGLAALEEGRADAFVSDRSILAALALTSKDPKRFALSRTAFSYEPYGLMMRRNDAAFRLVVNRALADLYRSGAILRIYERWFGALGAPGEALQAMYLLNALPE